MAVNPVLRQLVADGKATKNAQSGTQTKMTAAKSAAQANPVLRSLNDQQKTTSGTKKTDTLTSAIISTNQKAAQKKTATAERGSKHYTNRANQQRRAQSQVVANVVKEKKGGMLGGTVRGYAADLVGAASSLLSAPTAINEAASGRSKETEQAEKWVQVYTQKRDAATSAEEKARYQKLIDRNKNVIAANDRLAASEAKNYEELTKKPQQALDNAYTRLRRDADEGIQKEKEGLGKVGQFAVDLGVAGGQMIGDAALGAVTGGSALVPMAARVFGGSSQEAKEEVSPTAGKQEQLNAQGRALLYGVGSAALSTATEKVANVAAPFRQMFGGGVLDQAIDRAMTKMNGSAAGKAALSFLSEGGEEVLEDLVQPVLKSIYNGKSIGQNYSELELSDVLYDGLVGGALGLIGSGAELVQRGRAAETPDVGAGTRQAVNEGNFTPAQENAAEGSQGASAADGQGNGLVGTMRNFLSMLRDEQPVARITGAEIPVGGKIVERLQAFANSFGNKVNRPGFGDVLFSKSRIKNSMIGHGVGQAKIDAFAAVPDVIRNGQEIAHETNWKGRNYDTYIFAAPIDYKGATDYLGVIVTKDSASNRYYVHEVVDANGNVLFESKEAPSPASDGTSALSGDLDHVASGDASTDTVQAPVSLDPTVTQGNSGVKGEDMQRGGNYAPENHIDNRTAESVAPRSVNAFSFDHPELRGYYVEAAEQIAGIADLSRQYGQQMGARERTANGYQRTSSIYETPALRAAMNEGLTRSQIIDAADRLIKDHGQENVKAAKTLELILDDMLTNGYTNVAGEQVGPNAAYLAAKAQIDGAQPVQARQTEEIPIWDMDVPDDLPGSIGAARAGYQAPDVEPVERTSRLADSAARYTQAEGEATTRSREDYDALFRYRAQSEAESLAKADDLVYIERDGKRQFLKDADPAAYEELTQYLEYAPAWNAQMVDAAMQIKDELQGRSIAMEITEDEYTRWLDIMREHATETGRGTQAWAKYSRAGNEGGQSSELSAWENLQKSDLSDADRAERFRSILMYDKSIEQAETPEAMRDIILNIAEERGTLNGITGRQSTMLRKAAESALGSMDFAQLKQFAYESSAALSTDAQSANMGQKLKTVQVLNMLSNPKTAAKNIAGNTTFYALDAMSMRGAAVLDMALSKLTGTRSVAFEKSAMSSESRAAIMKAIRMSAAEITLDVDMGASGRYEQTGNRTFKASGSFIDRVLSACERNMGYLLTTSDEAYKGAARSTQRGTQELIESGKIQNAPKGYAASQADALAKYRTFQNDSKTATAIQTVHDVLNMALGVGDSGKTIKGKTVHSFGVGDLVAPFTRVAGNLAGVGLDYSPVNAVKGTVEIVSAVADAAKNGANPTKQAKAVSDFARGMTGTAIAYGFMQLAKMGLLKRADDEGDKDVAALNKSEGMTGAQVNITAAKRWMDGDETGVWRDGDTLVDLSNLEPLNFMVSLGADMALDESGSILSPFVATKDSILSAAGDLPVLQTVGDFAKDVMVYGTPVEQAAAESLGKTAISSITPNVLAAIAKGIDDKQRNMYAGDGTVDVLVDTLKSRIPKVRETLPTTVNTLGEEKDNPGSLSKRLTNALINPIGVNKYTQSEVSQEMERVRGATGETSFYPTTRKPDSLSYKDSDGKEHTVELDYDQKQAFQKACATGQMAYTAAMMKTSIYKAAGDTTKADLLDRCYRYSYEAAKAEVLGDGAVDKWVLHARNAKSELGMSTADYLASLEKYGSDVMSGTGFEKTKRMLDAGLSLDDWAKMRGNVDADGNGSVKKAELTDYIESHFPKEQWRALFDAYKGGQNWKNPY